MRGCALCTPRVLCLFSFVCGGVCARAQCALVCVRARLHPRAVCNTAVLRRRTLAHVGCAGHGVFGMSAGACAPARSAKTCMFECARARVRTCCGEILVCALAPARTGVNPIKHHCWFMRACAPTLCNNNLFLCTRACARSAKAPLVDAQVFVLCLYLWSACAPSSFLLLPSRPCCSLLLSLLLSFLLPESPRVCVCVCARVCVCVSVYVEGLCAALRALFHKHYRPRGPMDKASA